VKNLFLFGAVLCLILVFAASAFARDARLDYLVNQGKLTEEEIAAAEMEGPNNWMAKQAYDVYISGLVQAWGKYMDGADPDSTFGVHRARLQAKGMLGDIWNFVIQTELAGNVELLNVGVGVNVGDGQLWVGQFKLPLVLENITSAGMLDTINRSTITNQVDIRDMGAFLSYPFLEGKVGLDAAVTNGTGQNATENNDEKDYTVRVWAKPFQGSENPADGLMFAGAYNMGDQQALDAEALDLGDFTRTRWVGTLQWVWEQIKVQGEYVNIEQDVPGGGSAKSDGWYVYGSYDLPMDSMVVTPVVKWEEYDPDASSLCACGGNWVTLGVRVSFVGTHDLKLEANYVIEDLDEGDNIDEFILQLTANF
jgi:hypothetical protein